MTQEQEDFRPIGCNNQIVCDFVHAMGFHHVTKMVLVFDINRALRAKVTQVVTEGQVKRLVTKLHEFDIRQREVKS